MRFQSGSCAALRSRVALFLAGLSGGYVAFGLIATQLRRPWVDGVGDLDFSTIGLFFCLAALIGAALGAAIARFFGRRGPAGAAVSALSLIVALLLAPALSFVLSVLLGFGVDPEASLDWRFVLTAAAALSARAIEGFAEHPLVAAAFLALVAGAHQAARARLAPDGAARETTPR